MAGWGGAALLLAAPWAAMQVTPEMAWGPADFVTLAMLLAVAGGLMELLVRFFPDPACRAAAALALLGSLATIWINLAVGIVGDETEPLNGLFYAVPAIALIGSLLAWRTPRGMAVAMGVTGAAQIVLAAVAGAAFGMNAAPALLLSSVWLVPSALFARASLARRSA